VRRGLPLLALLALLIPVGTTVSSAAYGAQPMLSESPTEAGPSAVAAPEAALTIAEGSVARSQVVALGRDVVVAGQALSDVAAFNGSVRITGSVTGDLIVLNGDVRIAAGAHVVGDVFVLGGTVEAAPGSRIDGRTVAHPTASSAWLTLLEGPSVGLGGASALVLGTKLALMAAWMALALLVFAASGRQVLATSATVRREPFRCFVVGLTGVLALVLTGVAFGAVAPPLASAPLLVLVVLFALLLKLWGMVAVFHALGAWTVAAFRKRRPLALNAATTGLLILGVAKFVPHLGGGIWTVATLIGVGASLASKFGRQEAWFQMAELERVEPAV